MLTRTTSGGPSGIIYGFILVWIGQLSLVATLAEMASMAPTSGGQYHWVCMLAPPAYQKSFGYITGWMALIGWQAALASSGLLAGTQVQSIVSLTHPEYRGTMQTWQSTLILWAVLVLIYVINVAFTTLFAKFEGLSFIIHILGFFGIIFPLAFLSEHASAEDVFGSFSNVGGWQTQGLSFCIGLMGNVFAFVGGDAAIHVSATVTPFNFTYPNISINFAPAFRRSASCFYRCTVVLDSYDPYQRHNGVFHAGRDSVLHGRY